MITDRIKELPVIGILRGIKEQQLESLYECVCRAGLKSLEITMNTPAADKLISRMRVLAADKLVIGAGTVINIHDLRKALDAGASYIVTPSIVEEVIEYCNLHNIPVFPGALTPTEIHKAWNLGAAMVKVFPAAVFGPGYFKDIKGPFADIKLMAVGGVSAGNIAVFFAMGASGAAFGASIFRREWMENNEYDKIENGIRSLLKAYTNWKSGLDK